MVLSRVRKFRRLPWQNQMIRRNYAGEYWTKLLLDRAYGWRNGAKFTKFICIHIQCSYLYSRIYLFTFNNRIYILEIYLFTFTCVFLIHDYICSHLRDDFIHIQRAISIHIHDRNIHSTFSAHHLCASVSIKHGLRITDYGLRTGYETRTQV